MGVIIRSKNKDFDIFGRLSASLFNGKQLLNALESMACA